MALFNRLAALPPSLPPRLQISVSVNEIISILDTASIKLICWCPRNLNEFAFGGGGVEIYE